MRLLLVVILSVYFSACALKGNQEVGSTLTDFETPEVITNNEFLREELNELLVCSFNIKFLGFYQDKKDQELVNLVEPCDIVLVQELVATPRDVRFRWGWPRRLRADREAERFTDLMARAGFRFWVSSEDTGKNSNRSNDSDSEWHIAFYRSEKVELNRNETGYLNETLTGNNVYDRVPYAFAFSSTQRGKTDFVLINAHLSSEGSDNERRKGEFSDIKKWIQRKMARSSERDYILVGDLNIQSATEFRDFISAPPASLRMVSLNDACEGTNIRKTNPYDHIIFSPEFSTEIVHKLLMIDIGNVFRFSENFDDVRVFSPFYSDHFPIAFRIRIVNDDD